MDKHGHVSGKSKRYIPVNERNLTVFYSIPGQLTVESEKQASYNCLEQK